MEIKKYQHKLFLQQIQSKLKRLLKRKLYGNSDLAKLSPILDHFTFFKSIKQKLNTEKFIELLNELVVVETPKYQKVFKYGDAGRKFYIILEGSVFIITPDNSQTNTNEGEQKQIDYTYLENTEDKEQYDKMINQMSGMKIVSVMKEDDTFGEIALLSNVPRTATVVCREACTFVAINIDTYHTILEQYRSSLFEEDINFLQGFPFLQGWSKFQITNLLKHIKRVQCFGNQVIYNIGDPIEKIYMIKHGEFEILQPNRISSLEDFDDIQYFSEVDELNLCKKRNKKDQFCRAAILSSQCSFGTEEIASQQTTRANKVICVSSEALLYVLDKNTYFNLIKDRDLIQDLKAENKTKQDWREKNGEERKILKDFYSPKNSNINLSSAIFENIDSFQISDLTQNIQPSSVTSKPPKPRLSLQLNSKKNLQFQNTIQQFEYQNFQQSYLTNQQNNEPNQIEQSIRKTPLFLSKNFSFKLPQVSSLTDTNKIPQIGSLTDTNKVFKVSSLTDTNKIPKVGSLTDTNKYPKVSSLTDTNKGLDINSQNPFSVNFNQNRSGYQVLSSIQLPSPLKSLNEIPTANVLSTRSSTTKNRLKASLIDAQENERPLLDCYVNAMLKKNCIKNPKKVFTQKEFFAAVRQTQQKKRYCTPNEEGKNYIKTSQKQKENIGYNYKQQNKNEIPGSILGELIQDQKVKQDLHNIKQTFLHQQRMSLKNTQLHRKLTQEFQL